MGREIKFRAWDKTNNRWINDTEFLIDSDGLVLLFDSERGNEVKGLSGKWRTADEEEIILLQSTGLKDKNGKEIYEGDIVFSDGHKGIVVYEKEFAGFYVQEIGSEFSAKLKQALMEIIGNIYENPELLK